MFIDSGKIRTPSLGSFTVLIHIATCSRLPYSFTGSVDAHPSQKDQEFQEIGQLIGAALGNYGSVSWPGEHLHFDHQIKQSPSSVV
jgi:hypothetical protein